MILLLFFVVTVLASAVHKEPLCVSYQELVPVLDDDTVITLHQCKLYGTYQKQVFVQNADKLAKMLQSLEYSKTSCINAAVPFLCKSLLAPCYDTNDGVVIPCRSQCLDYIRLCPQLDFTLEWCNHLPKCACSRNREKTIIPPECL